jgi:hypothetical protein
MAQATKDWRMEPTVMGFFRKSARKVKMMPKARNPSVRFGCSVASIVIATSPEDEAALWDVAVFALPAAEIASSS